MSNERASLYDLTRYVEKGALTDDDVRALRRVVYQDGIVSRDEAEAMFRLNDAVGAASVPAWLVFFCEAMTDYVVRQDRPSGYVDEEEASWLIHQIEADGKIDGKTELYLLSEILRQAQWVPSRLKSYALALLVRIVCGEEGRLPLSPGSVAGVMGDAEVAIAEKIIYAMGDGPNVSVDEADALFRLEASCPDATKNSPRWPILFANAVSQHLMGYLHYAPVGVERAIEREHFVEDASVDVFRLFRGMKAAIKQADTWRLDMNRDDSASRQAVVDAKREACAELEGTEIEWLKNRLWKDGQISLAEQTLLDKLRMLKPALAPAIDALEQRPAA